MLILLMERESDLNSCLFATAPEGFFVKGLFFNVLAFELFESNVVS